MENTQTNTGNEVINMNEEVATRFLQTHNISQGVGKRTTKRVAMFVNERNMHDFTLKSAKFILALCKDPKVPFPPETTRSQKVMEYRRLDRCLELLAAKVNLEGTSAFNMLVNTEFSDRHIVASVKDLRLRFTAIWS
jgi:hypothetical protein